jgi:hypothetical protein
MWSAGTGALLAHVRAQARASSWLAYRVSTWALFVEGHRKGTLQVGAQGFDLGRQPDLGLAFGPHQLGAELGQLRRLALLPGHQFVAEFVLPALEFTPHMAVGQAQLTRCRPRSIPALATACSRSISGLRTRAGCCRGERVVELEPMHGVTYRSFVKGAYDTPTCPVSLQSAVTALELIVSPDPGPVDHRRPLAGRQRHRLPAGLRFRAGAGRLAGRGAFCGPRTCLTLLNTMLAVPSVVVGLVVYLLLSRSGPLGPGLAVQFQGHGAGTGAAGAAGGHGTDAPGGGGRRAGHGEQLRSLGAGTVAAQLLLAWDERLPC